MGKCTVCNDRGYYKDECESCDGYGCRKCQDDGIVIVECEYCEEEEFIKPKPRKASYNKGKKDDWGWLGWVTAGFLALLIGQEVGGFLYDTGVNLYEVISVHSGGVQVVDLNTGVQYHVPDPELVQKALDGTIKAGDTIKINIRGMK